MARTLILAQSKCTADALGEWIKLCGDDAPGDADPKRIVLEKQTGGGESGVLSYETLVKRIEAAAKMDDGSLALNDVVALVDSVNPARMSATADGSGWDHLLAMLILTFPEIKWVFGVTGNPGQFLNGDHSLPSLLSKARRDPLLDPTGLREWVRTQTQHELKGEGQSAHLAVRKHKAAAVDEEKTYAYFHAYTAYRHGFLADAVTSWSLMEELFSGPGEHGYYLLMEDMSLNFPDRKAHTHLLLLDRVDEKTKEPGRAKHCPKLNSLDGSVETSKHRILITTGQSGIGERIFRLNEEYLKQKACRRGADPSRGAVILKPTGGMLDLWRKAGLFDHLRKGLAPGFDWLSPSDDNEANQQGHGAPGRLMLVAETLLRRAEVFRDGACTVKDFIKGAVLATDAAELLGGRTPTLTLAAIALKHEYEARAECAFIGVGYHFNVKGRIAEIGTQLRVVCRSFSRKNRRFSALDATVVITNRLAIVFRESGQFEEEQICLASVRRAHRRLVMLQARHPLGWMVNGILLYAEFLLVSFQRFLAAIAVWLTGLTTGWFVADGGASGWKGAMAGVSGSFFGGGAISPNWPLTFISCTAAVVGVFHLGVFVSYLYSLISRK